jgi:hypothetical protein
VIVEAIGLGSKEAAARAIVHVGDGSSALLQGIQGGSFYNIRARAVGAGSTGHSAWCEGVSVLLPAPLDPAFAAGGLVGPAAEGAGKRTGRGKGKVAAKAGDAAEGAKPAAGDAGAKSCMVKYWLRVKTHFKSLCVILVLLDIFLLFVPSRCWGL